MLDISTQTVDMLDLSSQTVNMLDLSSQTVDMLDLSSQTVDMLDLFSQTVDMLNLCSQTVDILDLSSQTVKWRNSLKYSTSTVYPNTNSMQKMNRMQNKKQNYSFLKNDITFCSITTLHNIQFTAKAPNSIFQYSTLNIHSIEAHCE